MEEKRQVICRVENAVATIVIDNPDTQNGLNWAGINQLADCLEALDAQDVKVVVITGNDEYFYTGGRVDAKKPGEKERYADAIDRYSKVMDRFHLPMIAAISGECQKAGMGLLAKCDFAIAKRGVVFGYPEVRMGGVPMMVMAETFGMMPEKRALEAYLTSWTFSAEEAYQMGIINRVVDKEDFSATVQAFVNVFLETPPELIEMTRRAFQKMKGMPTYEERASLAMQMLRGEVLTRMEKSETQYNLK